MFKLLVFSNTAGYRHESIPAGIAAIQELGASTGEFTVEATEDATLITVAHLSTYAVVVFLQTSGNFIDSGQLNALQSYVRNGGGFVGIHGAAAAMFDEPWYGQLLGGVFTEHPEPQQGLMRLENTVDALSTGLPETWSWFDEWYNFTANPRANVNVLLTVDEQTYQGGKLGRDHPVAWYHEFDGGRSFYTSLGHFDAAYKDGTFLRHLHNGIRWAATGNAMEDPPTSLTTQSV